VQASKNHHHGYDDDVDPTDKEQSKQNKASLEYVPLSFPHFDGSCIT